MTASRVVRPALTICQGCGRPATLLVAAPDTDAQPRPRCRACVLYAVAALIDTLADEHLTAAVTVTAITGEG